MKWKPVKEGDVFFNSDKTVLGVVTRVELNFVEYSWINRHGVSLSNCKVSKRKFYKYAISNWHIPTSLEKELL